MNFSERVLCAHGRQNPLDHSMNAVGWCTHFTLILRTRPQIPDNPAGAEERPNIHGHGSAINATRTARSNLTPYG